MSKVVSDGYAISYRFPDTIEAPQSRGPPDYEFIEETGKLMRAFLWEFTLIECDVNQIRNSEFSVYMAHSQGQEGSNSLSFRQPSASCNYLTPNQLAEEDACAQHVVLPSTFGPPGEARTSLRITNGGNTHQYNLTDGPYRIISAFEHVISKQIPANVTWCVGFNFQLEWPAPTHTSLNCYPQLADNIVARPEEWMDSVQVQIVHGNEPKYLSVAFRVVDNTFHQIHDARYIKPILFDIIEVELDSEEMEGNVLKSVYWMRLRQKAETNGHLTLPLEYLD